MTAEDIFDISDEPLEEPPEYPEISPCQFCGGKGHTQTTVMKHFHKYLPEFGCYVRDTCHEKIKAYCFCGICKARGPIVVKEIKPPREPWDVDEMRIEAINLWNRRASDEHLDGACYDYEPCSHHCSDSQGGRMMTKHDRLIGALREIKEICAKNDVPENGCGRKCPFLMEADNWGFHDCEVAAFVRDADAPEEWGEQEGE